MDSCWYGLKECGLRIGELYVKCLLDAYNQVMLAPSACKFQVTPTKMNHSVKKRGLKSVRPDLSRTECGRETPVGQVLVIDGRTAERGELPWHVGVYRKDAQPYLQICGGSIIATTIVVSVSDSNDLQTEMTAIQKARSNVKFKGIGDEMTRYFGSEIGAARGGARHTTDEPSTRREPHRRSRTFCPQRPTASGATWRSCSRRRGSRSRPARSTGPGTTRVTSTPRRATKQPKCVQSIKSVAEIKIPSRFRGVQTNFQDDIALLMLSTPFTYETYVRPVCINFDVQFDKRQLQPGHLGKEQIFILRIYTAERTSIRATSPKAWVFLRGDEHLPRSAPGVFAQVAGWGYTSENGTASQILKVVDLPYVDINRCLSEALPGFREYITSDKICAGYTNGTALCKGDSGGGLSFPEVERGVTRYYLRGVVSTAPNNENACNAFAITSFTQITAHEHFITENFAGSFV
ncbi:Limulus clotting factor C [Eumeta japonica]|uniref:Limulus clotting factor C n=1 Tax=Eumeta variegata TaxID=151549 RepID=A0A4C1VBY9_EUMVA|nr:Limulus clotting factor C [Eumeta japonica]